MFDMQIIRRSFILAVLLLALSAVAAAADVRYASPSGPGSAPCADKSAPCQLAMALSGVVAGDEVELAPGDYYQPTSSVDIPAGVDLYGEAGKPRPVIRSSSEPSAVNVFAGATLSYVEVTYSGVNQAVNNGGTVSRSRIVGTNTTSIRGACLLSSTGGDFLNSICVSMGKHAFVTHGSGAAPGAPVTVRNSVGVSFSGNAVDCGLSIKHDDPYGRTYNFINTALESSAHGVCLDAAGDSAITLNLVNSNYRSPTSVGPSSAIRTINSSNSLQGPSGFMNSLGQDFHLAPGSPLINAGVNDPANGTVDFDGNPRTIAGTTDIGAFESTPAVVAPPAPTTTISKKLKSKSKKFTAAKSGAVFRAASKQPKKKRGKPTVGTLISFTLSQADDVTFTLERASEGRKSGSKCVKKTKANKSKKKCTYYKSVRGSEKATGLVAGSNTIWWTGRWQKKALAPGSYALRGTPIKASTGNEPGVLDPRPVKVLLK